MILPRPASRCGDCRPATTLLLRYHLFWPMRCLMLITQNHYGISMDQIGNDGEHVFPPFFFVRSIGETNRGATRVSKLERFPESLAKLFFSSVGAQRPGHGPCFRGVCCSSSICLSCLSFDGAFFTACTNCESAILYKVWHMFVQPSHFGASERRHLLSAIPDLVNSRIPVRDQLASNMQQKLTRGAPRNTQHSVTTNCASKPHGELSVQLSKCPSSV